MGNIKKTLTGDLFEEIAISLTDDVNMMLTSNNEPYIHQRWAFYHLLRSVYPKHVVNQRFKLTEIKYSHVKKEYNDCYFYEPSNEDTSLNDVVLNMIKQFTMACGISYEEFSERHTKATTRIRVLLYQNLIGLIPDNEFASMLHRDKYYMANYYPSVIDKWQIKAPKQYKHMLTKLQAITKKHLESYQEATNANLITPIL